VPVSCPAAAASGVIDADGVAPEDPVAPEVAGEVGGAVAAEADGVGAAADDELTEDEDEQPATARSTPPMAASTAAARRLPCTTKDDTELPIPDPKPNS
jgi:hypothetical protein